MCPELWHSATAPSCGTTCGRIRVPSRPRNSRSQRPPTISPSGSVSRMPRSLMPRPPFLALHQFQKGRQGPVGRRFRTHDEHELVAGCQQLAGIGPQERRRVDDQATVAFLKGRLTHQLEQLVQFLIGASPILIRAEDVKTRQDAAAQDAGQIQPCLTQGAAVGVFGETEGRADVAERVGVEQQDPRPRRGRGRGQVDRGRRLAHAAFLTRDQELPHGRLPRGTVPVPGAGADPSRSPREQTSLLDGGPHWQARLPLCLKHRTQCASVRRPYP